MHSIENNRSPLVSVIMPAYNTEDFVEEAVASVLSQSISDLELIIVDDSSKDRTPQILEDLSKKDERIRVFINSENMGAAMTRNRGLDMCRGKYVALLDSDDYWEPNMLEKMVARAEETKADIIYCSYEIVDVDRKKVCNDFIVPEKTDFSKSIVRSVITCSTVLITNRLASENRFPTGIYHEDIALWFQILRDGGTACGVTDVLAAYRQRDNSKTANKFKSACRRWVIYRKHLNMTVLQSAVVMVKYAYYGLIKFKRI